MTDITSDETALEQAVRHEIETVHRFIADWFRGETAAGSDDFENLLAARLAPQLINIQPAGHVLTREELLTGIRKSHGANPAFGIEIRDVQVRARFAEPGLVLATYTEMQTGALNTSPSDNTRISTVLLQRKRDENSFTWLHIHETAR
jgi:hypothetical protein